MSKDTQLCSESDHSLPIAPEVKVWFEVVKLALWDYAHLRREFLTRPMKPKRAQKLKALTHLIFARGESIDCILSAIATDRDYMIESVRGSVSDELIATGFVLGKKMRDDDPVKGPEREKRYARTCG